jgi:peptidyl-prolyl cis-trans isomerase D
MFESLRYNLKHNRKSVVKSATAWFLFGAIIVVMAFLGMTPQQPGVGQGGVAARVNSASISLAQFADVVERMRRDPRYEQLQALGGDAGRQYLNQQALTQLVEMELISQASEEQQLWTSDAEVRDVIVAIPQFQENGRFKRELYMNYLRSVRKSPGEFEAEIRKDQSLRRAFRMFSASVRPLPMEAAKVKALSEMKANLEFIAIPTETLVMPESISEADIKSFLASADSQAKVKDHFQTRKAEFASPEKVKARHILIRAEAGDAAAQEKARVKIEEIAKRAQKEDFAKLASELSEDPGSKANGGLLDFFARGRMVPEFEEVAFSLAPNQISQPVKTQFGFHLIQALEKKPAVESVLEDVQDEIAAAMIAKERSQAAISKLQNDLKAGNDAGAREFIAQNRLKWQETGPFSIETENIPKLGPSDEAHRIAFSLSSQDPMARTLVKQGSTAYLLRHKPVASGAASKKEDEALANGMQGMQEMMAGRRSEDVVRQWVDGLRKDAKIVTNPQVISRPN